MTYSPTRAITNHDIADKLFQAGHLAHYQQMLVTIKEIDILRARVLMLEAIGRKTLYDNRSTTMHRDG